MKWTICNEMWAKSFQSFHDSEIRRKQPCSSARTCGNGSASSLPVVSLYISDRQCQFRRVQMYINIPWKFHHDPSISFRHDQLNFPIKKNFKRVFSLKIFFKHFLFQNFRNIVFHLPLPSRNFQRKKLYFFTYARTEIGFYSKR